MDFSSKLSDRSPAEFNPYRCGACGRANTNLKICSGCRLISFCSMECQKKYWKIHKPLCKVVSKIITDKKKTTIFKAEADELSESLKGSEQLILVGLSLIFKLPDLLRRNLNFEERMLFNFPKFCAVCYETNPHKMKTCVGCKYASFCKEGDCQRISEANPWIHEKYCPDQKLAFMTRRDYQYKRVFTKTPRAVSMEEFISKNPNFNIFTLIESIAGKKFVCRPNNREEMDSCSTVCQFNFTASIIYALHRVRLLNAERNTLDIHVVGAQYELDQFTKETIGLFYVFLPKLETLKISFIGPEIVPREFLSEEIDFFGRSAHLFFAPMFYENFSAPDPDFIVCLNSGFNDNKWGDNPFPGRRRYFVVPPGTPDTDWVRGMKTILKRRIPFAFTSFIKSEIFDDAVFVKRVAESINVYQNLTAVELCDNPFQDLRPFLNSDISSDEPLLYANSRICIMNWKENLGEEFNDLKNKFEKQIK